LEFAEAVPNLRSLVRILNQQSPVDVADSAMTMIGGNWHNREKRTLRYRLRIPMMPSYHSPEYTAHGVMIGTIWAMTPFIGIQTLLIMLTWIVLS